MKADLTSVVGNAIIEGLTISDPEAIFHEPDAYPGRLYVEGKFAMEGVASRVLKALADAMTAEAGRYEGAPGGADLMAGYRDMARILRGR